MLVLLNENKFDWNSTNVPNESKSDSQSLTPIKSHKMLAYSEISIKKSDIPFF